MTKDTLISESELLARIRNICRNCPYLGKILEDLAGYKSYDLRRWKGVGKNTVEQVKAVLAKANLVFADS